MILYYLGMVIPGYVTFYYDNEVAIIYIKYPKFYGKTKNIDIQYNFIRDIV